MFLKKQSCTLGSDLMSLVPQWKLYASEDGLTTNSSLTCFQVYIMIFSTLAFVCDGSNIISVDMFCDRVSN